MGGKIINNCNMKQFKEIILALVFTIAQTQTISAQGFNDDVPDAPPASIDQWIIPILFLAIGLAYFFCIKVQEKNIKIKERN
jgi:hypothetical protein